ncbi:exported-like protein 3 [Pectobacterium sp. F1-1]|uniref:hypothetical protein n=1 Tax=Pectobacterium sp. F1-1 TaxID=2949614 RepID=UPI0021D7C590|nr:hypothetical protein [Pectobacterium sp. F1-1]UYA59161.1 exported-like protein 3 [Pectobacterium sp. F1-1]
MSWLAIHQHRHVALCASLFFGLTAFNASALECRLGTVTGPVNDYEDIGTLKIPATLPIGSRLWTSKPYTRSLACWAYKSVRPQGEMSYFYPNPEGKVISQGVGIGIIYNGQDLGVITNGGTTASRVSTGQWIAPGPSGSRPPANPTMLNVTVQLYLEKNRGISPIPPQAWMRCASSRSTAKVASITSPTATMA